MGNIIYIDTTGSHIGSFTMARNCFQFENDPLLWYAFSGPYHHAGGLRDSLPRISFSEISCASCLVRVKK